MFVYKFHVYRLIDFENAQKCLTVWVSGASNKNKSVEFFFHLIISIYHLEKVFDEIAKFQIGEFWANKKFKVLTMAIGLPSKFLSFLPLEVAGYLEGLLQFAFSSFLLIAWIFSGKKISSHLGWLRNLKEISLQMMNWM